MTWRSAGCRPVRLLVDRAGMPAALGVLGAFTRAHRGATVALDGDIRYRPKT